MPDVGIAKTAFVTGGTGFVGLNVVEQLVAAGWRVTAMHRAHSDLRQLHRFPVQFVEGDLSDEGSLSRAVPRAPDAVFHLAANTSTWSRDSGRQLRDNVQGTASLLKVCLAAGAKRFVYTSSWNAWGWVLGIGKVSEDIPQRGLDSPVTYDRSKALAEAEVRAAVRSGLEAVIINPAHVIGRYDTHNWARLIKLVHQRRLPGVPPGSGSFCHAEAVARAHIVAAERGRVGENYLLGGADASFLEVVQLIGELTRRGVPQRALPAPLVRFLAKIYAVQGAFTGREPELTPDGAAMVTTSARVVSDKAQREIGYRPASLRHMLEDSYRWLVSEGLLDAR